MKRLATIILFLLPSLISFGIEEGLKEKNISVFDTEYFIVKDSIPEDQLQSNDSYETADENTNFIWSWKAIAGFTFLPSGF